MFNVTQVNSHSAPQFFAENFLARQALRKLMGSVAKNPKLVDELASKDSRKERIALLVNHKLIASQNDLPAGKEAKRENKYRISFPGKREEIFEEAKSAWAIIVAAGSYEA